MHVRHKDERPWSSVRWASGRIGLLMAAIGIGLVLPGGIYAATRLPEGVPNILAPEAAQEWHAVHVGDVRGDGDLPVLLVTSTQGEKPAMLVGLDSRNGTEEYSLESDPVIFVAMLAGPQSITTLYYDTGFAAAEQPSGQFRRIAHPTPGEMPDFVRSIVPVEAQARTPSGEGSCGGLSHAQGVGCGEAVGPLGAVVEGGTTVSQPAGHSLTYG